jgi:outer membrane protein assembly factor BamA
MRHSLTIHSILFLALATSLVHAAEDRFFKATPGYTRAKDLPDSLKGSVSALEFRIYDAFEGSETHSGAERALYDLGNKLHINTREATLRRRLPFRAGDTVSIDGLREAEKHLRGEEFLADAIIEVRRLPDSTLAVKVTTYDQWSTVLGVSLGRKGGEWVGWLGPVESNLLGTGQRLGFFVSHDLERDSRLLDYSNTAFTPWRLRALAQYAWLSDGYSYAFSLTLPLRTRGQRWGFSISASGYEFAETQYLSGNNLDQLEKEGRLDSSGQALIGRTTILGQWQRTQNQSIYAGVTRTFGSSLKTSITPFYQRNVRDTVPGFGYGVPTTVLSTRDSLGIPLIRPGYDTRHDEILGATFSVYRYAFKTVHNFRNLKWSENIETGWRLSASAGQNQRWLGARDPNGYFVYAGVYNDAWHDAIFLNSSASLRHFLSGSGEPENGSTSAYAEGQWKPFPPLATVLIAQYDRTFANPDGQKLYLGEESGLLGYPNFYYAGYARFLASAEQRFFPPWEFGTVVPALAVFLNAGNAWDGDAVRLHDLHLAAGVGLRLGATRSVQKVVNHINLTWPLGEKNLTGPVLGLRASKSL